MVEPDSIWAGSAADIQNMDVDGKQEPDAEGENEDEDDDDEEEEDDDDEEDGECGRQHKVSRLAH